MHRGILDSSEERLKPCINISCATGIVQNIQRLGENVTSFELWGEVMDCIDGSGNVVVQESSNRFYLISKIFIYPRALKSGNMELLKEDTFVSTVYRSFQILGKNEFREVLLKIEEPNVENDAFMIEHLSKTINNKFTAERFWLNKIIRFYQFDKNFWE